MDDEFLEYDWIVKGPSIRTKTCLTRADDIRQIRLSLMGNYLFDLVLGIAKDYGSKGL